MKFYDHHVPVQRGGESPACRLLGYLAGVLGRSFERAQHLQ
jgi:hypothetical protein